MKLSDYLLYRDIHELGQIASLYKCDCNYNSKLDLVQSIHHRMMSKSIYQEVLQKLDPALLRYFTFILFQGTRTFSIEELIAKGKFVSTQFNVEVESPRSWITLLLKRGWLFPSSTKYQIQLEIPLDLHLLMKNQVVQFWVAQSGISAQIVVNDSYRDERSTLIFDLQTFLTHLAQSPLPLTVDGVIHKRNQQLILQKMNVQEELVPDKSWRFGYGRRFPSYPNRFSLIYDFCYSKGWIHEEQGGHVDLSLKGKQILSSKQWKEEETYYELIQFWLKTYKKPIPALPFIMNFITEFSYQKWIDSTELYAIVRPWLASYYYDDTETIFRERIIQMLVHLGILQISVQPDKNTTFCRINDVLKFS